MAYATCMYSPRICTAVIRGSFSRHASMPMITPKDQDEEEDSGEDSDDAFKLGRATTHSSVRGPRMAFRHLERVGNAMVSVADRAFRPSFPSF